jgi:hypothetical protein
MKNHDAFSLTPFVVGCAIFLAVQSCADNKLPAPDGFNCSIQVVSYSNDVLPIIDSNCAIVGNGGCHNGGNGANLDWRVFTNVQSRALQVKDRITRASGSPGHMPMGGSLSDDQIRLMVCWVDQGAQNN